MTVSSQITSNPVSGLKKRTRMARGDRRSQLLAAARRILRADGVKALTMERLAEAARISKPVVYSHFENRSMLIVALLEEHWAHLDEVIPQRPAEGESYEQHLNVSIGAFFDAIAEGDGVVHLLYRVTDDPIIERARQAREQRVTAAWVAKAIDHFDLSKKDAETAAMLYRATLEAAAALTVKRPADRAKIEVIVVEMSLAAVHAVERQPRSGGASRHP